MDVSGNVEILDAGRSCPVDRSLFPVLERRIGRGGESRLVYLDSAATSLVPTSVTDAAVRFLHTSCANIHRGAHTLAEEATDAYESAREHLAVFLGVGDAARLLFTHGSTESCNVAALAWADRVLEAGDVVAVAEDNHHANIVCWQMLAARRGIEIAWIPLRKDGLLDYDAWQRIAERPPRLVALAEQSNVIGWRQPALERIVADARVAGAVVVLDGAQAVGHERVDFDACGADFYAASAHKMMGLTGIGCLACSERVLERMQPALGGGGMVERVDRAGFVAAPGTQAFEAGTPAIAAAVAWDEAVRVLEEAGMREVSAHVAALASRAQDGLAGMAGVRLLGGAGRPCRSLVSFEVEGVHPHDVSALLDARGVLVRAGHHCAQPLHAALGSAASVRASFAAYSTREDVDALLDAMEDVASRAEERGGHAHR